MEEVKWLSCADPRSMLEPLFGKASERKMRLFACACVRSIWNLLWSGSSRYAVEEGERYADGAADLAGLVAAYQGAWEAVEEGEIWAGSDMQLAAEAALEPAWTVRGGQVIASEFGFYHDERIRLRDSILNCIESSVSARCWEAAIARGEQMRPDDTEVGKQRTSLAVLARCIFGNFFRPPPLNPVFRKHSLVALAQAAYENRTLPTGTLEPDRLAVLADALEEAGCTDADILGHLRGQGPHVRGCFVLDLILGKS